MHNCSYDTLQPHKSKGHIINEPGLCPYQALNNTSAVKTTTISLQVFQTSLLLLVFCEVHAHRALSLPSPAAAFLPFSPCSGPLPGCWVSDTLHSALTQPPLCLSTRLGQPEPHREERSSPQASQASDQNKTQEVTQSKHQLL